MLIGTGGAVAALLPGYDRADSTANNGGRIRVKETYVVGERGPELFIPCSITVDGVDPDRFNQLLTIAFRDYF